MMALFGNSRPRGVFFRLLLAFAVSAIPLYVIGFAAIAYFSTGIVSHIRRTTDDAMYYCLNNIESELSNIRQMMVTFCVDNEISLEMLRGGSFDPADYQTYNRIKKRLINIYHSSRYLNDVFVMFLEPEYEINATDSNSHLVLTREHLGAGHSSALFLGTYTNSDYIIYLYPSLDRNFVMGVEIHQTRFVKVLKAVKSSYPFGFILMDSRTGQLLGKNANNQLDNEIYEAYAENTVGERMRLNGVSYVISEQMSYMGDFTLITYIEENALTQNLKFYRNIFLLFVILSALFFVFIAGLVNQTVHKPLTELVRGMRIVEQRDYDVSLRYHRGDEFGYVYKQFNSMVAQTKTLINEVYIEKIKNQQIELRRLQSHINPHFLYNSLYMGYRSAIDGDTETAAKLCKYLGDYFRFITYFSNNLVSLSDELRFTETYLSIQKLRYGDRLDFTITNHSIGDRLIPVLIFQPLVENSIQYGVAVGSQCIAIHITLREEVDELVLMVSDNGPGMTEEQLNALYIRFESPDQPEQSYGLWNIYWRLRYQYGKNAHMSVTNNKEVGLSVVARVPLTGVEGHDV
jgi:two-component system sensor histidine kinase YesM